MNNLDIENILDSQFAWFVPPNDSGKWKSYKQRMKLAVHALTQRELQSRLDENDIWLAHSTSRVIDNDDKPAIRSSDFKERMSELQAQLNSLQGE